MIALLLSRFAFQLSYVEGLVADIPDERMAEQPAPGMNSPAWILGHLTWAAESIPALLGLAPAPDERWVELYGKSSKPVADRSLYGSKADLLSALRNAHHRAAEAVPQATPEQMAAEMPVPDLRWFLPTIGDALVQILTSHEAMHIGQLSAWRRVVGLPPWDAMMYAK